MGWQIPSLSNRKPAFSHPWEIFAILLLLYFIANERSEILVELNHGLSDILESSIFSHTQYPFTCENVMYEIALRVCTM